MRVTPWTCADCRAENLETNRFCGACGSARIETTTTSAPRPSADWTPPWDKPSWKDSRPEDACTEPGCALTVRDHIEQFRRIVTGPAPVFARRLAPPPDEHAQRVREQAAALLRNLPRPLRL